MIPVLEIINRTVAMGISGRRHFAFSDVRRSFVKAVLELNRTITTLMLMVAGLKT